MPEVKYAKSGDLNIAYCTVGDGPFDLVYIPGFVSHVETWWELPLIARHLSRLASFSRFTMFDKRGVGMSDPWQGAPTLDERMDDIRAVMDDAAIDQAAIFAISEGGPLASLFAATHPDRVQSLILYATGARLCSAPDYPHGVDRETAEVFVQAMEETWGQDTALSVDLISPTLANDEAFREAWARARRRAASPKMAADLLRMNIDMDIREVLPLIQTPTLVIHRTGDRFVSVEHGRYLADHIDGARYLELPGDDHLPFVNDDDILSEVEEFLTGSRAPGEPDRVFATVVFTDIVGSTERAAAEGDRHWRELLDAHDAATERQVERFGGRRVKSTGDGCLATFDRPGRAIEAARAVVEAVRAAGLEVRAGLHAGEVEVRGEDIGGIAVHIGARVAALAAPGEVLVSSTVKDLVVGSPFTFDDRGVHELKGVPGEWRLCALV